MAADFFLSYANADADGYVTMFFTDLAREVQQLTGAGTAETGFRDQTSLRTGSVWPQELMEALNTARAFVPLYSPNYFASEFCGREWTLFAARVERYRRQNNGDVPPTVLPVQWVPAPYLPEVAQQIQYGHEALGAVYAKEGLFYLLRLKRYRDDYLEVLHRLAQRLVEVTERYPMPPLDADYPVADAVSAFAAGPLAGRNNRRPGSSTTWDTFVSGALPAPPRDPPGPRAVPARPRLGPKHVHFVVVSAPSRELAEAGIRDRLHHYGARAFDWAPYRPELEQRISVFAQAVAADQDLTSNLAEAAEVLAILDRAGERNELVVLLVDVWTTRLAAYRRHMLDYDVRNEPSSAVILPWSRLDDETVANSDRLYEYLSQAFPRNIRRDGDLFRDGVETSVAFRDELVDVLTKVQQTIFRDGRVGRRAGGASTSERPILQFPDREVDQ